MEQNLKSTLLEYKPSFGKQTMAQDGRYLFFSTLINHRIKWTIRVGVNFSFVFTSISIIRTSRKRTFNICVCCLDFFLPISFRCTMQRECCILFYVAVT